MVLSVCGADFVFASGTLFVAKVALPGEQSVASALFQTMNQACFLSPVLLALYLPILAPGWHFSRVGNFDYGP